MIVSSKSIFVPIFNKTTKLASVYVKNFHLYSSIENCLPIGYFDFLDKDGAFIETLEGITIGSIVQFEMMSDDNDINGMKLPEYTVLAIETIADEESMRLAGKLRIYFGHKWFLRDDFTSHAYPQMNNSKLVKQILEDDTRGFKMSIDSNNIENCDSDGIVRYKFNESDREFLFNKVLPYSTHNNVPMHLFCNLKDEFYFKSFQSLFTKKSNILYMPRSIMEDEGNENTMANISSKSSSTMLSFSKIESAIGNKDCIHQLSIKFLLDSSNFDLNKNEVSSGLKLPANVSASESSTSLGSYLPLDSAVYTDINGTSTLVKRNHLMSEEIYYLKARSKDLDNLLSIKLSVDFNGKIYNIGDTCDVYVKQGHWANEKWLVTDVELKSEDSADSDEGRNDHLMQIMTLSRPSMMGEKNISTLKNLDDMYEVNY